MPYNNAIPQPIDQMNDSQGQMLSNFETLQIYMDVNHYSFGDPDAGKHRYLTFTPAQAHKNAIANEVVMRRRLSRYTNRPEVAYNNQATPANAVNLITARQNPQQNYPGWAIVGGSGLIMKWGQCTTNGGLTIFQYPDDGNIAIPRFQNAPYSLILSVVDPAAADSNVAIRLVANSAAFFSVYGSARTAAVQSPVTFYYLAIGN